MDLTNTQAIGILVGAFMPFIITIVKQAKFNKWWNMLISIVACTLAGVLTVWARGELTATNIVVTTAFVFTSAQAVYGAFWKNDENELKLNDLTSLFK